MVQLKICTVQDGSNKSLMGLMRPSGSPVVSSPKDGSAKKSAVKKRTSSGKKKIVDPKQPTLIDFTKDKPVVVRQKSKENKEAIKKKPKKDKATSKPTKTKTQSKPNSKGSKKSPTSKKDASATKPRAKPEPKLSPEEKRESMLAKRRERYKAKREERDREREEKQKHQDFMKQWNKKRDDLECEDLAGLPPGTIIKSRIPIELFGDAIMTMEFFNNFSELFDLQDFFPSGLNYEILEEAMFDQSSNGSYADLVKLLLTTVFALQIEEDKVLPTQRNQDEDDELTDIEDSEENDTQEPMDESDALGKALKESVQQTYHGQPLSEVELEPDTITEILRLHLLSSGSPKGRSIQRGWFSHREDPGLILRLDHPELFKSLSSVTIFDLDIGDRLIIFNCLINQVMSFSRYRDFLDEAFEEISKLRKQMRNLQSEFSRWERENSIKKPLRKKEDNENNQATQRQKDLEFQKAEENYTSQLEKFKNERERRQKELQAKFRMIRRQIRENDWLYGVKPIGRDRAYRKYWIFNSIPGLFVEEGDDYVGDCLPLEASTLYARAAHLKCAVNVADFRKAAAKALLGQASPSRSDSSRASDKENNCQSSDSESIESKLSIPKFPLTPYDYCTGDKNSCSIHGERKTHVRAKWRFYHKKDELNALIASLNQRGFRESKLREELERDTDYYTEKLAHCPAHKLNPIIPYTDDMSSRHLTKKKQEPTVVPRIVMNGRYALRQQIQRHVQL